jgi:hypothetical protein
VFASNHLDDEEKSGFTELRAEITTHGRQNELVETIAVRHLIEPGVTSLMLGHTTGCGYIHTTLIKEV